MNVALVTVVCACGRVGFALSSAQDGDGIDGDIAPASACGANIALSDTFSTPVTGAEWTVSQSADATVTQASGALTIAFAATIQSNVLAGYGRCRHDPLRDEARGHREVVRVHGRRGLTVEVGAKRLIEGMDRGVLGMRVGEVRKLRIPYELAYGERGARDYDEDRKVGWRSSSSRSSASASQHGRDGRDAWPNSGKDVSRGAAKI